MSWAPPDLAWRCAFTDDAVKAAAVARIRATNDDFRVTEILGFEPSGEGEHDLVEIEKDGQNTDYVARRMADYAGVHRRDVSYSGLKDRHAITRQWFSVRRPPRARVDWEAFRIDGVRVLRHAAHSRKLKRGSHRANRFRIVLRDLEDPDGTLVDRLKRLSDNGFPNYFGEQRFGRGGRNLERAEALFSGHRLAREPRSMAISAARSLLFNAVLSRRVADGTWSRLIEGELANLDGTGSVFAIAEPDAELRKRAAELDIHPTGPLWGRTGTKATLRVRELELAVAATYLEECAAPARRALRERARCLDWEQTSATLSLEFELGRGSFATALLRELVTLR